nr:DUF4302 domain-containing protein [uncultured Draconibacterium sp.]
MKNKIYIILVAYVLSIVATSCKEDTEYIFDESASGRKAEAIEKYEQALKSSENGWVFQYFPEENQQYGGYTYVVKFDERDSVSVWFEWMGNLNSPVISLYDVIGTGGPTLTFNTYNGLMHFFATPTGANYQAYGGDYEFLFLSEEDDVISVKGTKTGNEMRLVKLDESPVTYIQKVNNNEASLNKANLFVTNDDNVKVAKSSNRNFVFEFSENGTDTTITVPYIVTAAGIRFYEPVDILGTTYQNFTLDPTTKPARLVSEGGSLAISLIVPPVDLTLATWYLDISNETGRSAVIDMVWKQIFEANIAQWGEELGSIIVFGDVRPGNEEFGISFYSYPGPYRSHYDLSFNSVLDNPNYLDIVKVGGGFNWTWYTHFLPFVDLIANNSPYNVEMDDEDTPTVIKLTSVTDSDVWFVIQK